MDFNFDIDGGLGLYSEIAEMQSFGIAIVSWFIMKPFFSVLFDGQPAALDLPC